jgi:hypothetical protein
VDITQDLPGLMQLCQITNRVGWEVNGKSDTCILMSAALHDVLTLSRIPAEFLRVRAAVHCGCCSSPRSKHYGCVLGSDGDGTRLSAARPDHWRGHLVVIAGGRYLMDPTLDQVNVGHPWLKAEPFTGEVTLEFLHGEKSLFTAAGKAGSTVCYTAFPGRGGFKSAPDMRPSHRREIVRRILQKLIIYSSERSVSMVAGADGPITGAGTGVWHSRKFT